MKGSGRRGRGAGTDKRDGRKEAQIFQCAYSCRLPLLPQRLYRRLSPKHSGAALSLPGAGHSCGSQETLGAVWLQVVPPSPLEVGVSQQAI